MGLLYTIRVKLSPLKLGQIDVDYARHFYRDNLDTRESVPKLRFGMVFIIAVDEAVLS
jgi:hypothetical protein